MQSTAAMVRPMFLAALVTLLVVHAPATMVGRQQALETAWGRELDTSHTNPVTRVVKLLGKMKSQLDAEASKEAEMYDKMVCWCETNEKEKTKAIADAEIKDNELSSEIESRSARVGKLTAEIAKTKEEIAENTASLEQATKIREKEAAKFGEDQTEMVQAITNLRNAVAVLSKHQGASLVQLDRSMLSGMRVLLRNAAIKYEVLVAGRAEARGEPELEALVALRSERRRVHSTAATGVDASLLNALDAHGAPVSEAFPLKFAAQLVAKAVPPSSRGRSFLQLGAEQPIYQSGSTASSGIYGVMTQMLDEFQAELKTMRKDEEQAQADFTALSTTKTDEIESGKAKLDEMQSEDAANSKALSDAKEDLTATRKQRSDDVEFLQNLKVTCDDLDSQWEKRSKTRTAETKAVAEAIEILTEEDSRATFARSVSLLQERSRRSGAAAAAAAALRHAAQAEEFQADDLLDAWNGRRGARSASFISAGAAMAGPRAQLSTLATAVQLDSFTKVKEMMDTMIAELKKQQADEVKFKDYCQKELKTTEKEILDKNGLKKDLESKLSQLEALTDRLGDEIDEAKKQISETEVAIKKASETREEENKEFQSVVADQRASQTILKKALNKLKDFYEKGIGKAVLAQRSDQTPPVQFNDYENNAGSNSVVGLMEQIIEDSKALEKEALVGETKAQSEYESFVKDSNSLIKSLQDSVSTKSKAVAAAKGDSAEAQADLGSAAEELESLAQIEADLHGECDWLLKSFDIRQKARLQEIESVQQAKSILSGA
mmetsp:Transcript_142584/g.371447  ORF Transcript_142584/g.371447 Transcript_142584/m.371447 type:complete len:778 (-) Transcript_142584:74-2407(-)